MFTCSSRSNPILVPSIISPENIVRKTQDPESYVTARDPLVQKPQAAEMSTPPNNPSMDLSNLWKFQKAFPVGPSYTICS